MMRATVGRSSIRLETVSPATIDKRRAPNDNGTQKDSLGWQGPKEEVMSDYDVRMVVLSTDDLEESIRFYTETLGMSLKFRDGAHYAALDGGSITLALATAIDHPMPGQVVVGIKTANVDAAAEAIEANGGAIVKQPYNDAHERRAVVYDHKGNGLVFYSPLPK
jgi:lactoylglutathione lyase